MLYDFGKRTNAFKNHIQFEVDDNFIYTKENGYTFCLHTGYVMFSSRKDDLRGKYLHRVLMEDPSGLEVDHHDMNRLNNCMSNLRVCTHAQNNQNRTKHSTNTSGFKGVSWNKSNKKWYVQVNGKSYGLFKDKELANAHAIKMRRELCGEFTRD